MPVFVTDVAVFLRKFTQLAQCNVRVDLVVGSHHRPPFCAGAFSTRRPACMGVSGAHAPAHHDLGRHRLARERLKG